MNQRSARELRGKTVDRIEREGEGVVIYFTDGTAVEVSGDRPQFGQVMVYIWRPKYDHTDR